MRSETLIWLFIGVCLNRCQSRVYEYDRPTIVTYGEPCVASRQLPIMIEGPKPPVEAQRVPLTMDFKVISDMYVNPNPRRLEYPIAIDVPLPPPSPRSDIVLQEDTLRGRSYAYNTYIPPASDTLLPLKQYNFDVRVPISKQEIIPEAATSRYVQRLRGLSTRIDRVLVPACEVSSSCGY
ncbi:uncharacterized protein LOC143221843 [Lasioglossum baleicum]|uniref:uncharacterized protein LOC143221843 n=1 Tax=Lasioglossum baleicum TaxID=434251 RepID=UPI003FCED790